jgi:hypothetical protein
MRATRMLQIAVKEIPRYKQQDVLEGGEQCDQLHGPLSTVPGPYDEYLGRVRDEGYQTEDEADNYPSQDIVHPLPVAVVVEPWWAVCRRQLGSWAPVSEAITPRKK